MLKSGPEMRAYFVMFKLPKVNSRSRGGESPNLVALLEYDFFYFISCRKKVARNKKKSLMKQLKDEIFFRRLRDRFDAPGANSTISSYKACVVKDEVQQTNAAVCSGQRLRNRNRKSVGWNLAWVLCF
jgi:hypothetical protein